MLIKKQKVKATLTNPRMKIRAIKYCRAIVQDWLKNNVSGYRTDDTRFAHLHFGLKQAKWFVEGIEMEIPQDCIPLLENGTSNFQQPLTSTSECRTPSYHSNSLEFEYEKNEIEILLHREIYLQRKIREHQAELAKIHKRLGIVPKWSRSELN